MLRSALRSRFCALSECACLRRHRDDCTTMCMQSSRRGLRVLHHMQMHVSCCSGTHHIDCSRESQRELCAQASGSAVRLLLPDHESP